jgi:hypothetical protein
MSKLITDMTLQLETLKKKPDLDIDKLTTNPPTVLDCCVAIHVLDDTLYYVSKAFGTAQTDAEKFIKNVKFLAREKYMKQVILKNLLSTK